MRQWQDRKAVGDAHERRVAAALRARGWTVHPCGQGTYPPAVRDALRRTRSALRQFPDRAFHLVRTEQAHHFDDVFGSAGAAAAA
ncbi:hypothetical protein ACH4HG_41065 [Streptomyces coeruleorubidus]|uniref:hypothetical protein n=1 Tax=Streptomyces coeruleorubidus TaxID=116188 RepID=UPI00199FBBC5|nr:hypothetical protein [Streptomyces bellus]GGU46141.1 hypothetical protein GCM10010244_84960 [Streptomyces bellus]